ncbi:MAG: tRNA (adenosine(37)-N6)-threonylcarbamoyltransferase complex dimerization subunit type 1 TsaB [Hyphomicrobiales bacterium]|nr:MAG: tRNA (adenosine(37)-N6)-threonylcarbamoyltransferase complex dimerization subunit type 1 TsaB [Hyphomicrobiales bacterium]
MVQLSIDTCNQLCAASLSEMSGDKCRVFDRDCEDIGRGHAELLASQVDRLLKSANRKPTELSRIAVTIGPGSFTGQRVGLALARSMGMALKIDVLGINVLDALLREAQSAAPQQKAYCAILDARRGGAYVKCIDAQGAILIDTCLLLVEDMNAALQKLAGLIVLIGTGVELVDGHDSDAYKTIDVKLPAIETIAQLGHQQTAMSEPVTPLYLRAPDAKPQSGKHLPLAAKAAQL